MLQAPSCPLVRALLSFCVPGAGKGDYAVQEGRSFKFAALRTASKSGAFGFIGKHVELASKPTKGFGGGIVINGEVGKPETYVKLCAPTALKKTVRVLCYARDAWFACALQDIVDRGLRAHVVSWCAFVLGVEEEVGKLHAATCAATATNAHVFAHEKAKKAVARMDKSLKRLQEKRDEAAQVMQDAYECLQTVFKKSRIDEGGGSEERKVGGGGGGDEDDDGNGDDGDNKKEDIRILKISRNLYRKSEQALQMYRLAKKNAKSSGGSAEEYKAAKKKARRQYIKNMQDVAEIRKRNRDMLRKAERGDLLTKTTHIAGCNSETDWNGSGVAGVAGASANTDVDE